MSWTQRSLVLEPYHSPTGMLTTRQVSIISQKSQRKGISLSKEHESKKRNRSPSFIRLTQKGKTTVVQKRSIKLILKPKESQQGVGKQNNGIVENRPKQEGKQYMDIISTNQSAKGSVIQKQFGKFPLKKAIRKERRIHPEGWHSIQLY